MKLVLASFFGFISILLVVCVAWRISSSERALPCPAWLGWLIGMDNPFAKIHHAKVIALHLELLPGMKVLDAGCGPGRVAVPIAEWVGVDGEVVAMDIQEGMLKQLEQKVSEKGLQNVIPLQGALGFGNLPRAHFDRALLVTVLGEIPDKESAMKELFDTLKPGGMLVITEMVFDPHFQRKAVVLKLASEAGFCVKENFGNALAYTIQLQKK